MQDRDTNESCSDFSDNDCSYVTCDIGLCKAANVRYQHYLQSVGPGWRVEFRPLEVQLTDFENAAFAVCVVLLAEALLNQGDGIGANFYLPMSLSIENMRRAQQQNAIKAQKFFVRQNAFFNKSRNSQFFVPSANETNIAELTLAEIFCGRPSNETDEGFLGLLPFLSNYLDSCAIDKCVMDSLNTFLQLLFDRSSGRLPSTAQWLREKIERHVDYNNDGIITPEIADDLLQTCQDIGMGRLHAPDLYGNVSIPVIDENLDDEDLMYRNFTSFTRPISFNGMILPLSVAN